MSSQGGPTFPALGGLLRRRETPVVLCIDVEPDPQAFDPAEPPPWLGFETFVERLPALRARLSALTGSPAAFTWCLRMDPQIAETWGTPAYPVERYGEVLGEFLEAGDELGVHTHVWRWDGEASGWICDFEDSEWAVHCVEMGLEAFESSFGRGCRTHRGGTQFVNWAMLSTLEAHEVPIDLTVQVGMEPLGPGNFAHFPDLTVRGQTPDYRLAPTRPYRTSSGAFPAADPNVRTGPLLIPAMSARRRRPPFHRTPLLLEDPQGFSIRLGMELVGRPPVMSFGVRSDAMDSPLWDTIEENLASVARSGGVFTTASGALEGKSADRRLGSELPA